MFSFIKNKKIKQNIVFFLTIKPLCKASRVFFVKIVFKFVLFYTVILFMFFSCSKNVLFCAIFTTFKHKYLGLVLKNYSLLVVVFPNFPHPQLNLLKIKLGYRFLINQFSFLCANKYNKKLIFYPNY